MGERDAVTRVGLPRGIGCTPIPPGSRPLELHLAIGDFAVGRAAVAGDRQGASTDSGTLDRRIADSLCACAAVGDDEGLQCARCNCAARLGRLEFLRWQWILFALESVRADRNKGGKCGDDKELVVHDELLSKTIEGNFH